MAGRQGNALQRITDATEAICADLAITAELNLAGITHRDPGVRQLWQVEALADQLEAIAAAITPNKQAAGEMVLEQVENLTKTSREAIEAWMAE